MALILRHFCEASRLASLASLPGLEHDRENICTRESTDDQRTEQALWSVIVWLGCAHAGGV